MIPPSGAREDGLDGLPKETASAEQPPSPASTGSQESKISLWVPWVSLECGAVFVEE
ncbi:hypothetical protein FD754_005135 [Muntiacus muntjak]|uniref:Uncharacterized protein n=1 Tax=Muntiacus muntjak TaxID=9888 RepID=A0A5N3WGV3_MUNMU|nr:hypothetical protein FD754_005135 [Muntiacus muntjak]